MEHVYTKTCFKTALWYISSGNKKSSYCFVSVSVEALSNFLFVQILAITLNKFLPTCYFSL